MARLSGWRALTASCFVLASASAWAQGAAPWVDPPKDLAPAAGTRPVEIPAAAPSPAASAAPAAAPPRAAEPEAQHRAATHAAKRTAKRELAPARQASARARAAAPAKLPAAERRARIVQRGLRDGLELMLLETVELPNGEQITVLTEPDAVTMRRLTRGR